MARSDWFDEDKAAAGGIGASIGEQAHAALDRLFDALRDHGHGEHIAAPELAEDELPQAPDAGVTGGRITASGTGFVGEPPVPTPDPASGSTPIPPTGSDASAGATGPASDAPSPGDDVAGNPQP